MYADTNNLFRGCGAELEFPEKQPSMKYDGYRSVPDTQR